MAVVDVRLVVVADDVVVSEQFGLGNVVAWEGSCASVGIACHER